MPANKVVYSRLFYGVLIFAIVKFVGGLIDNEKRAAAVLFNLL